MENDPLAQLRDIHLPEPISWWPLAPGWWALIILCLALSIWLVSRAVQRWRANLYRRQALQKLTLLNNELSFTNGQKLVMTFEILKQAVNSAYPSQFFSSLELNAFVAFLQSSCDKPLFALLPEDLDILLYGKPSASNNKNLIMEDVFGSSQQWLRRHYPEDKLEARSQC